MVTQSKGSTRKYIGEVSRSVRTYFYLIFTSKVQARSSIVGHSASVIDAQQVFNNTANALISDGYSIALDIGRYQSVSELSTVDFATALGIYVLQSDMEHRKH